MAKVKKRGWGPLTSLGGRCQSVWIETRRNGVVTSVRQNTKGGRLFDNPGVMKKDTGPYFPHRRVSKGSNQSSSLALN